MSDTNHFVGYKAKYQLCYGVTTDEEYNQVCYSYWIDLDTNEARVDFLPLAKELQGQVEPMVIPGLGHTETAEAEWTLHDMANWKKKRDEARGPAPDFTKLMHEKLQKDMAKAHPDNNFRTTHGRYGSGGHAMGQGPNGDREGLIIARR